MNDIESCLEATQQLNKTFQDTGFHEDIPVGCYLLNPYVYFNFHPTGRRDNIARQICKPTGTASIV